MVLLQANIHQNDTKCSLKSSKQHLHKEKHKKRQKCSGSHEKKTYPKITKLKVPKAPGCDVGCQSCKINVRNEIFNVWFISFDKIKVMMRMPKI